MAIIYNPNKNLYPAYSAYNLSDAGRSTGISAASMHTGKNKQFHGLCLTYADHVDFPEILCSWHGRTYSLDALPQEYPSLGTGDYRNIALNIKNEKGGKC